MKLNIIEENGEKVVTGLKEIVIPDGVKKIGDYAFYEHKDLKSIIIPDSVTSIGRFAFYGCNDLTIICIPGSYAEGYATDNKISVRSGLNPEDWFELKEKAWYRRTYGQPKERYQYVYKVKINRKERLK